MNLKGWLNSVAAVTALAVSATATAAEVPSSDAANSVVNYYYSDQSQPVLMDFKVCSELYEEGENKHNCKEEVPPEELTKGTQAKLWMKFLVPRAASPRVLMQINHKGITRDSMNRELDGAIRYRTWNTVDFSRTGDWDVQIFFENEDQEVTEVFSRTLEVKEASTEEQPPMDEDMSSN